MALKIPCPHCGPRDYTEFMFGGELRPMGGAPGQGPTAEDPHDDFARVYLLDNAPGVQRERWFHLFGCRRWLELRRDTRTNEVAPGTAP